MPYLSNKLYNILKFIAQIFLPALGTLYFSLANLWNLPSQNEVVGTVVIVDAFLGTVLGLSTAAYNSSDDRVAGDLVVKDTPSGMPSLELQLEKPNLDKLVKQDEITFKVKTDA